MWTTAGWILLLAVSPQIEWEAPVECPSPAQLQAMVATYLVSDPDPDTDVRVSAYVHPGPGPGWTLHLTIQGDGPTQQHEVRESSCAELAAVTAALTAATLEPSVFSHPYDIETVAIDVHREAVVLDVEPPADPGLEPPVHTLPVRQPPDREPVRPASEPAPTEPVNPSTRASDGPGEPASRRARIDGTTSISAGGGFGLFPGVHAHIHADGGIAAGWLRASAFGLAALGGRVNFDALPGAQATIQGWALGVNFCAVPGRGRWALLACARIAAGAHRAASSGVALPRHTSEPWILASPTLGFQFALRPSIALQFELGAGFNLLRPVFFVADLDGVEIDRHVTPVAFGFAALGFDFVLSAAR